MASDPLNDLDKTLDELEQYLLKVLPLNKEKAEILVAALQYYADDLYSRKAEYDPLHWYTTNRQIAEMLEVLDVIRKGSVL